MASSSARFVKPDTIASTSDADTGFLTSATADTSDAWVGPGVAGGMVTVLFVMVVVSDVVGIAVVKVSVLVT